MQNSQAKSQCPPWMRWLPISFWNLKFPKSSLITSSSTWLMSNGARPKEKTCPGNARRETPSMRRPLNLRVSRNLPKPYLQIRYSFSSIIKLRGTLVIASPTIEHIAFSVRNKSQTHYHMNPYIQWSLYREILRSNWRKTHHSMFGSRISTLKKLLNMPRHQIIAQTRS